MRLRHLFAAALLLLLLPQAVSAASVYVVEIDGVVSAGTVDKVKAGAAEAETGGYDALLLEIDTDGGLLKATREINQVLTNSGVPVITYVTPRGGRAYSAGTFLLLNGHVAAAAPETQVGAATPVKMGATGSAGAAEQKVVNAMESYMRSIAESRGRNVSRAALYVSQGASDTSREAVQNGILDLRADSTEELLGLVDGRTVEVGGQEMELNTAGASLTRHTDSLPAKFRSLVSNPQLAFLLFAAGMLAVWFGIQNPGLGAEVVGPIALLIGLYGMGTFSSSTVALTLLALAGVLLAAELVTPTSGVLGAAGIACLVLGGLMLPSEPLMPRGWYGDFAATVVGVSVALGGFVLFAASKVMRSRERPPMMSDKLLVGRRGEVVEAIPAEGEGKVKAMGSIWSATAGEGIDEGEAVEVVDMEGLKLMVERK